MSERFSGCWNGKARLKTQQKLKTGGVELWWSSRKRRNLTPEQSREESLGCHTNTSLIGINKFNDGVNWDGSTFFRSHFPLLYEITSIGISMARWATRLNFLRVTLYDYALDNLVALNI